MRTTDPRRCRRGVDQRTRLHRIAVHSRGRISAWPGPATGPDGCSHRGLPTAGGCM